MKNKKNDEERRRNAARVWQLFTKLYVLLKKRLRPWERRVTFKPIKPGELQSKPRDGELIVNNQFILAWSTDVTEENPTNVWGRFSLKEVGTSNIVGILVGTMGNTTEIYPILEGRNGQFKHVHEEMTGEILRRQNEGNERLFIVCADRILDLFLKLATIN